MEVHSTFQQRRSLTADAGFVLKLFFQHLVLNTFLQHSTISCGVLTSRGNLWALVEFCVNTEVCNKLMLLGSSRCLRISGSG